MKIAVCIMALSCLMAGIATVDAGHNHHAVNVVTPFAVPVAVPVAPYSATYYSNQTQPYTKPLESEEDRILRKLARFMLEEQGSGTVKALAEKPTLFASKCATCHNKNKVDGFRDLNALTSDQKLEAIEAVVTERMPKGGKLSPEEVGQLMLELSSKPKATIQSEPPPKPEGEKQ